MTKDTFIIKTLNKPQSDMGYKSTAIKTNECLTITVEI